MNLFGVKSLETLDSEAKAGKLHRSLGAKDLLFLGIGAVIGAGIFSTLGTAAVGEPGVREGAGPALVVSFALLGAVCALAGLCYAELTSMIPISGSAYTYTYATLGELVAWIIGWDLILEYAVGNVAVAIAWSGYFGSILEPLGITLPYWLTHGYGDVMQQLRAATAGANLEKTAFLQQMMGEAPQLFGRPLLVNLPAMLIVGLVTWVLVLGVKESTKVNNGLVWLKLAVLALFLGVGIFHIDMSNWQPFAPNGWAGIHQGAAIAFFAYIGFDAISTASEEAKNPQRDMPKGILGALVICTLIYMAVGAVATGLVPFTELASGSDPLARALAGAGLPWVQFVLSVGAVISMTAVLLVFQLGQPRIFYSMSRDGLLPKSFGKVHPKYKTPYVVTIITGVLVALGAGFMDDDATYDLTNIGTLFAFALVCIGVLVLRVKRPEVHRPFRVKYVWLVAPAGALACVYVMTGLPAKAWERFGIWLAVGLAIYFLYGVHRSKLGNPGRKEE